MCFSMMFMFFLANFPVGLVIYWTWNNLLSVAQQYVIMRRMGVSIGGGTINKGSISCISAVASFGYQKRGRGQIAGERGDGGEDKYRNFWQRRRETDRDMRRAGASRRGGVKKKKRAWRNWRVKKKRKRNLQKRNSPDQKDTLGSRDISMKTEDRKKK